MRTATPLAGALLAATLLAGCGATTSDTAGADEPVGAPVAGMCAPDQPDCVDTIVEGEEPTDDGDAPMSADDHRARAEALLGVAEADVPADVRVARRGDEAFMLTEDYVIGRRTVELDDAGDGTYEVTKVVLELEDGPETFEG